MAEPSRAWLGWYNCSRKRQKIKQQTSSTCLTQISIVVSIEMLLFASHITVEALLCVPWGLSLERPTHVRRLAWTCIAILRGPKKAVMTHFYVCLMHSAPVNTTYTPKAISLKVGTKQFVLAIMTPAGTSVPSYTKEGKSINLSRSSGEIPSGTLNIITNTISRAQKTIRWFD